MNRRVVVAGVAGVVLLMPLSCSAPSAPSRTTAPRTVATVPAAVRITTDGVPFTTCWGVVT